MVDFPRPSHIYRRLNVNQLMSAMQHLAAIWMSLKYTETYICIQTLSTTDSETVMNFLIIRANL